MGPRAIIWTPRRGVSWCYQDDFHVTSNFSWPANTDLEAELTGQSVTSRVCPPWGSPNDMTDRLKRKTETCKLIRLDSWFSPPPKPNYRWMYNIQESTVPSEVLRKTTCTSGKENDLFPPHWPQTHFRIGVQIWNPSVLINPVWKHANKHLTSVQRFRHLFCAVKFSLWRSGPLYTTRLKPWLARAPSVRAMEPMAEGWKINVGHFTNK